MSDAECVFLDQVFSAVEAGKVVPVALSPDGDTLASTGGGGAVILSDAGLGSLLAEACRIVNRILGCADWRQFMGDKPYRYTCEALPGPAEACR